MIEAELAAITWTWKQIEPWLSGVAVVASMILAAALFVWMRREQQDDREPEPDLAAEVEAAYFRGEIDESEYRRVLEALGRRPVGKGASTEPSPPRADAGPVAAAAENPEPPPVPERSGLGAEENDPGAGQNSQF